MCWALESHLQRVIRQICWALHGLGKTQLVFGDIMKSSYSIISSQKYQLSNNIGRIEQLPI